MDLDKLLEKIILPEEAIDVLKNCKKLDIAGNTNELVELSLRDANNGWHTVSYDIEGQGNIKEAIVCKVKNGISANYLDPYMRRREPDCMFIGDNLSTDKKRYIDEFGKDFDVTKKETLNWLKNQELAAFYFMPGNIDVGVYGIAILPSNAGFFALSLALLQGIIDVSKVSEKKKINCILYVAPSFRHTHFNGKQVVAHRRSEDMYEIFSYNLYPGPSAKKGIYGALLHFGEKNGWLTAHASTVSVITPYDNKITIMHEGASGGGKSEMNEHLHREFDGSILFGENVVTNEKRYMVIPRGCNLKPVTDDMALCPPSIQKKNGKLTVYDAENSWFIRVDHIKNYGTDPDIEARTVHPLEPMVFINIDAQPNSTALLWEHIEDSPGRCCPNPRFILPRKIVPDIVNNPVGVDVRSFGVRTPPSTINNPNFGIIGIFHVLPPAIAWIWRLVAPRGFKNPSIIDSGLMESEGVGSFWPFATGHMVNFANILLEQIIDNPKTHYILTPNQHIGAWNVGFMPQWIMREYIARRGGVKFTKDELSFSKCTLLGYSLNKLIIEGQSFDKGLLQVDMQPEVGIDAYNKGAKILTDFFKKEAKTFLKEGLNPLGKNIIECFLSNGGILELNSLINAESIFHDD